MTYPGSSRQGVADERGTTLLLYGNVEFLVESIEFCWRRQTIGGYRLPALTAPK